MPRKQRTPKLRVAVLPSPAWTFQLLAGTDPQCRLPGWPEMFMVGELTADEVWARHGTALIEEARRHGFEPFWVHKHEPHGAGFSEWRERFLAEHAY